MKKIYLIGSVLSIFLVLVFALIIVPIILDSFKKPSLIVATIKVGFLNESNTIGTITIINTKTINIDNKPPIK